ncbi:MAG: substrate-binding domain-containing protein [Clostridia bacterium]|nr:substrate-binding domain-containing protein [Clostridia bacterium]
MRKRKGIVLLLVMCLVLWGVSFVSAEEDPFDDLWDRIDGSTATVPLVQAMRLHFQGKEARLQHSTTSFAYEKLCNDYFDIDLIFVTPPSPGDLDVAWNQAVELETIPVTREALVFLNNVQNPVESLTVQELRDIYTGRFINWSEVGGQDAAILPFQRPYRSGSQSLFLACLMGSETPMEPAMDLLVESMGLLIDQVSAYNNGPGALGYSVFYYATRMYANEKVCVLAVDGVMPNAQTIADGTYPLSTHYYAVLRKDTPPDHPARQLVAWLLSEEGQRLVAEAGYVPLIGDVPAQPEVDAEEWARTRVSSGTGGTEPREHTFHVWYRTMIPELPEDVRTLAGAWWAQASMELYGEETELVAASYRPGSSAILNLAMRTDSDEEGNFQRRTAVVDIGQKKILQLSDLFYDGVNYIDYINSHIAFSADRGSVHWEGVPPRPSEENNLTIFTGLPNDHPYFLFFDAHTVELLFDGGSPFWDQSGEYYYEPVRVFVPLNHWVSPWGGCTVETSYRDHPTSAERAYVGALLFPVPSLRIDGGNMPEAEARINAKLAQIAQRHIAEVDSWVCDDEWPEIRTEVFGQYAAVMFCLIGQHPMGGAEVKSELSINIFDLHTGEWFDTDELFDTWKDSPQAVYVARDTWQEPQEILTDYRLPEGMRPASIRLGYTYPEGLTLNYYFDIIEEGWLWMELPLLFILQEEKSS